MLVASAGFWSLVMVRQSRHAPDYPSFPLGTYKAGLCTLRPQCLTQLPFFASLWWGKLKDSLRR